MIVCGVCGQYFPTEDDKLVHLANDPEESIAEIGAVVEIEGLVYRVVVDLYSPHIPGELVGQLTAEFQHYEDAEEMVKTVDMYPDWRARIVVVKEQVRRVD